MIGVDGSFEERLEWARRHLSEPFEILFDRRSSSPRTEAARRPEGSRGQGRVRDDYMMVIEGTLALTGQYFMTEYFGSEGLLPGFLEGFRRISQDERRHVAYGTWFLQQKCRDPRLRDVARTSSSSCCRSPPGVLVPQRRDPEGCAILGYTNAETNTSPTPR